tara:strand:+ start:31304 stop:31945 length:642 start_codon:yes stop_codon:yes gene_type:complete
MVKSILRKSTKGNRRNKRNHTKRVHFNKYKKVKTFKRNQTIKKRRKTHHKKPKSKHHRAKTVKHTKSNKRNKNKKHRKMLKMKGGCAGNLMGQKVTGVPLNPQDYQHPEYTNLNSNVPYPYSGGQKGGSLWDTFGLGDIPIMKNTIINSGKNMISSITGGDAVASANPTVHPAVTKSMVKYPQPIDIPTMHNDSLTTIKADIVAAENNQVNPV